jgi:hypothetical protein
MQHCNINMTNDETATHSLHTRAQNHPDKQKSHKSRYMSRIGATSSPGPFAAIISRVNVDFIQGVSK